MNMNIDLVSTLCYFCTNKFSIKIDNHMIIKMIIEAEGVIYRKIKKKWGNIWFLNELECFI